MRILFYELKKIWSVKLLLVIGVLCSLFYYVFLSFHIDFFPNGHPHTEQFNYSVQLLEDYGPTLEEDEFAEFIPKTRKALLAQAEHYIKTMPIFAQAGIHSYADYEVIDAKGNASQLETDAIWALLGEECDYVRVKISALDNIERSYESYPNQITNYMTPRATSQREQARLAEIQGTEAYQNILDDTVFDNTVIYSRYLAVLTMLAVLIFVSPLLVTDRARKVHLLQYSTKRGRKILNHQLAAVLLSACLLTNLLLLAFGVIYSKNGTWLFWNQGLTSFLNFTGCFLFNMTYGQYIIAYIVLLNILSLGVATIAFVLSRYSQNLITLILKLIPTFALMCALCVGIFHLMFSSSNPLYYRTSVPGIEGIVCGLLFLVGLSGALHLMHREKRIDVV